MFRVSLAGRARRLFLLSLVLVLSGCVKPGLHRPQNIESHEGYKMAFIEFDDHGEPWASSQLERTVDLIQNANKTGRCAVLLFVHGWHNDASKREDRKRDNNVEGFQQLLDIIQQQMKLAGTWQSPDSLIGVYIGWRGRSTDAKLLKPLTFYSRRGAGQRVAGVGTTETILRVMAAAKRNPESVGVVIGHSFGGMIVERALMQALAGYTTATEESIQPLADLVVLLNPASQSMNAKAMLSILERNRLKLYRVDEQGGRRETPFVVSVTSTGDTATGNLYPMALGLKGASKRFREYEPDDCSPFASQKTFYKKTAGHNPVLHSHIVTAEPLTDEEREFVPKEFALEESVNKDTGFTSYSFRGEEHRFNIDRLPFNYNDSPYWIMNVPPELIRGHSDIFTFNTLQLMRALLRLGGFTSGREEVILVRETGIRPLHVGMLPDGSMVFVERSRRFYAVSRDSNKTLALSCLPSLINTESLIGGFQEGSRLNLVSSGQEAGAKKPKLRTDLISFDFAFAGSDSVEWVEFKSDLHFTAAVGRAGGNQLFLTAPGALYVADLERKKPEPQLVSRFGQPENIDEMEMDPDGSRIFAIDREGASVYVIDLEEEEPAPRLVAPGLGAPVDLFYASDRSLLILDAIGKRILKLDCSQGRGCTQPEEIAAPAEFESPISLVASEDGTVWVGDLEAQAIFALDRSGRVVRVLDSVSGFGD